MIIYDDVMYCNVNFIPGTYSAICFKVFNYRFLTFNGNDSLKITYLAVFKYVVFKDMSNQASMFARITNG